MPQRLTEEQLRIAHGFLRVTDAITHLSLFKDRHAALIVVPYMRASTHRQRKDGNPKHRDSYLRRRLKARGIACHEQRNIEVVSGRSTHRREGLKGAISVARELQRQYPGRIVVVVTDTRNRFIRGRYYNGQAQTDAPDVDQLRALRKMAGNVILATFIDPQASHERVRAYETRLAVASKGRCGRPPKPSAGYKKERRRRLLPRATRMRRRGHSLRQIARNLKVPLSTLAGWLKERSETTFP